MWIRICEFNQCDACIKDLTVCLPNDGQNKNRQIQLLDSVNEEITGLVNRTVSKGNSRGKLAKPKDFWN